jgi:uroporphyrinogen decarboxylase
MTSREIVQRTLDFTGPERVARSFGDSDLQWVRCTAKTKATEWREVGGGRSERIDEWGNLWARLDETGQQGRGEVVQGALPDLARLDAYEFPDYSRPEDYAEVRQKRAEFPNHWLYGGLPGFAFRIASQMRMLDQYLMELMTELDRVRPLHDRIDDLLETMIRNYAAAGMDAVMFPEDWGTQHQTLINPNLWRQEFFPRFEKLCAVAHQCGIKVFMHSCGQITAIVPGLIAAGVDLLQFDQPDLHGIDVLAGYQKRNKITFWCPVDIQRTLQLKDEAVIRAKVREMLDKLWRGRGGFIAGYYGDNVAIGLDPRWQEIACNEVIRARLRTPDA